jgi:hypothetical protein
MNTPTADKGRLIQEAIAAAAVVANEWLADRHPALTLVLVDTTTVKLTVERFVRGARRRKVTWWDWQNLFYKKVRGRSAWLFALRRGELPVALCLGTISVSKDHVALEYLERRPYVHGVRGAPLAVAFQFALALASGLGISEVRINSPLNDKLARYYERRLEMTPVRHGPKGDVQYLYKKLAP